MTDERLPVVLWGKFACDVSEAMQVREEHSTVLVLRFAKIKVWKGKIHCFTITEFINNKNR